MKGKVIGQLKTLKRKITLTPKPTMVKPTGNGEMHIDNCVFNAQSKVK